jgi:hypothetical protein
MASVPNGKVGSGDHEAAIHVDASSTRSCCPIIDRLERLALAVRDNL